MNGDDGSEIDASLMMPDDPLPSPHPSLPDQFHAPMPTHTTITCYSNHVSCFIAELNEADGKNLMKKMLTSDKDQCQCMSSEKDTNLNDERDSNSTFAVLCPVE